MDSMTNNNCKISVVLPAYNEAESTPELLEKTNGAIEKNNYTAEIVFVDDGSIDGTTALLEKLKPKYPLLKVVRHRRNMGLTQALLSGFEASSGEIIVFLCADLQSDPQEDIPKLINKINEGFDVVLGWRQGRKNRVLVSKIGHLLCRLFFGISLHDMNWIKAFKREVIKDLPLRSDWHRYIAVLAKSVGYNITEVKTNYYPRRYGKSRFGRKRIIAGLFDLLTIKFQISFMKRPMFFFGTIGLIFVSLGFLIGIGLLAYVIYTRFTTNPAKAWYILLLLLFIVGLNFFSLGFLAEFLVTITERLRSLEKNKD